MSDVREVKTRIKALLRERRTTENKLADGNQVLQKRLNNQISHDGVLTVETLLFIMDHFQDVSGEWLLRGTEPMDAGSVVGDNNIANNRNTTVNDTDAVRGLVAQLAEKDKQLAEKDKQIGQLLQIIAQRPVQ